MDKTSRHNSRGVQTPHTHSVDEPMPRTQTIITMLAAWPLLTATQDALPATAGAAPHGARSVAVQSGGPQYVCNDIEQRYVVNQSQLNTRLLNFLLFDAAESGCAGLVQRFLAEGASVAARDRFGNTALLRAAHGGRNQVIELLLASGSDIHQQNLAGSTALLRAVMMNRRRSAKLLLETGAKPSAANKKGITPLIAAAYAGNRRLTRILLEHGAQVGARDATGKSAIVYAAGKGYVQIVAMLLDAGVDINERYENDLTALIWAAGHSNDVPVHEGRETVILLLERDADLALADDRGRTPLMTAAERGHAEIVTLLLEAGADASRRDANGKTAYDLSTSESVREALLTISRPRST